MQKISPHLWFDKEAVQAAEFYTGLIENSKIKDITTLQNTPSGTAETVTIELAGQEFMLLSAGPLFKFNPSISFIIACKTIEEVDSLWNKLADGGTELMPLDSYDFSEKYGWIEDKFGVSWQLIYVDDYGAMDTQKITPTLLFTGDQCGKADEAISYYTSVFSNSKIGDIYRYGPDEEPDKEGTVKHAGFVIEGQEFAAMDSALAHAFNFNEAISFIVYCKTQKEIDYYWDKLSAVPEAEQCGWLKDKFGVSWQIIPTAMKEMMKTKDPEKMKRVTEAFLKMKNLILKN